MVHRSELAPALEDIGLDCWARASALHFCPAVILSLSALTRLYISGLRLTDQLSQHSWCGGAGLLSSNSGWDLGTSYSHCCHLQLPTSASAPFIRKHLLLYSALLEGVLLRPW